MKTWFNIIKNNCKYLSKKALRWTCTIATAASIIEIAIGRIIDKETSIISAFFVLLFVFLGLWLVAFIVNSLCLCWRKKYEVFSTDKHSVYLHFGDMLNNEIVNNDSQDKYIVITVNRCFDTIVNNQLISAKTLHGKVFKYLYDERKYDEKSLQDAIDEALRGSGSTYVSVSQEDKPQGNLKRYEIGTVAKIQDSRAKYYFLFAMTTIDRNLTAHTPKQDFVLAIQRLIEYCDRNSQGYPVVMPLLGSGFSRTGIDNYSDILRYIIDTLRLNKDIINCDYHIYLLPEDKQKINFENL